LDSCGQRYRRLPTAGRAIESEATGGGGLDEKVVQLIGITRPILLVEIGVFATSE
jgi:hypothetical protein